MAKATAVQAHEILAYSIFLLNNEDLEAPETYWRENKNVREEFRKFAHSLKDKMLSQGLRISVCDSKSLLSSIEAITINPASKAYELDQELDQEFVEQP